MSKSYSGLVYWLPTLLWMGLIFILSSRPAIQASQIDWQDFMVKKSAHFMEYFILNSLFIFSMKRTTPLRSPHLLLLAFILTVAYAVSDEFHQTFIPGREGRSRDVFIDSLGAATSTFFFGYRLRQIGL